MIITNVIGGLGNQMFQYACGRSLSLRTDQSLLIAIDQFDGYALHNGFDLQRVFHIDATLATEGDLRELLGWQSSPTLRRLFGRPAMRWLTGHSWANEPHFQIWHELATLQGPRYLHGYWQSEGYFLEHAAQIRADFEFRVKWDAQDDGVRTRMRLQPSASIHVRRGDYTHVKNKGIFALCGLDYYRKAIRMLRERVPGVKLFAFSDDPDWVDAHLGMEFGPLETVRHNSGDRSAHDMRLMSQADHHIIANSSFSWWGAWLNPAPNKVVIAPRNWFLNGTDDRDLIPKLWIRV